MTLPYQIFISNVKLEAYEGTLVQSPISYTAKTNQRNMETHLVDDDLTVAILNLAPWRELRFAHVLMKFSLGACKGGDWEPA